MTQVRITRGKAGFLVLFGAVFCLLALVYYGLSIVMLRGLGVALLGVLIGMLLLMHGLLFLLRPRSRTMQTMDYVYYAFAGTGALMAISLDAGGLQSTRVAYFQQEFQRNLDAVQVLCAQDAHPLLTPAGGTALKADCAQVASALEQPRSGGVLTYPPDAFAGVTAFRRVLAAEDTRQPGFAPYHQLAGLAPQYERIANAQTHSVRLARSQSLLMAVVFDAIWPLFIVFALALKIVKTTAEIHLQRAPEREEGTGVSDPPV